MTMAHQNYNRVQPCVDTWRVYRGWSDCVLAEGERGCIEYIAMSPLPSCGIPDEWMERVREIRERKAARMS